MVVRDTMDQRVYRLDLARRRLRGAATVDEVRAQMQRLVDDLGGQQLGENLDMAVERILMLRAGGLRRILTAVAEARRYGRDVDAEAAFIGQVDPSQGREGRLGTERR